MVLELPQTAVQVVERLLVDGGGGLQQLVQQRRGDRAVWDLDGRQRVGRVPLSLQLHALLLPQTDPC